MKRYRVRLHWQVAATVFVEAEDEAQAEKQAGSLLGEPARGSWVVDGVEETSGGAVRRVEESFAFWRHRVSGEVYAIRQRGERVTGCCGPLRAYDRQPEDLPHYHYDDRPEDVTWAQALVEAFDLVETDEGGEAG